MVAAILRAGSRDVKVFAALPFLRNLPIYEKSNGSRVNGWRKSVLISTPAAW